MAYTHIQCIGYQVPTVAKVYDDNTGSADWTIPSAADQNGTAVSILQENGKDAYTLKGLSFIGNINFRKYLDDLDADADAKNRVIRFLNVLYKASRDTNIDNKETTLKVFTAPEFYFRPEATVPDSSIYRAYSETVYKAIKEVLRQTIRDMNINHWLIVPGTIMWYMPAGTVKHNKNFDQDTYFNSAVYIYNYPGYLILKAKKRRKISVNFQTSSKLEKSIASAIDGVPYDIWDFGENAPEAFPKYADNTHLDKHLFTINGVKTGIEICLEHEFYGKYGILTRLVQEKWDTRHFGKYRHLQLLVAGGMPKNLPSIVLLNKGVFFRNDGYWKDQERYIDAYTHEIYDISGSEPLEYINSSHTISLNNDSNFELQPPPTPGNKQLSEYLPFNDQKILIFLTQKIS